MAREITSKVYDEDIISQGLQFQIDNYYQPKEIFMVKRIQIVIKALNPKSGEKILDIGCGVGTFAFHAAKAGAITTGIDYSEESIKTAKTLCDKFGVAGQTTFVAGSALQLPFGEASFDKVVSADFIEHITDQEKVVLIREIMRVLKPNGMFVIFTPNKIREDIGALYWKIRHALFGDKIPTTDLHYGLISKYGFEKLLSMYPVSFKLYYDDIHKPYLTKIPLLRVLLSLNLLWIINKK